MHEMRLSMFLVMRPVSLKSSRLNRYVCTLSNMHAKKPLGEKKEQSCANIEGEREHLYHTGLLWAHRNPKEAHFKTNVLRLP